MTQKLLIYHPPVDSSRAVSLTYDNMWDQAGFSGTDAAIIEIGKRLVDSGRFEVTVLGYSGDAATYVDPVSGIRFMQWSSFGGTTTADGGDGRDINDYDWYCPLFYTYEPQNGAFLRQIRDKTKTKVLVWLHCFLKNDVVLHQWRHEQYQVYGMAVSQWVFDKYVPYFEPGRLWLVPNGIAPRFYQKAVPFTKKERGMWCFHPCFVRGGSVSVRVFEQVRQRCPDACSSFHTMSYYTPDQYAPVPSFVQRHGSLSKTQVAALLGQAEYFVYPLVLSCGAMHHDTYGCCILEALAMGVIVVTWDVACVPQLYGDYVVALRPPEHYPADNRGASDPWFLSEEAVARMADAVVALEADPGRKAELRRRGMEWARQQTWDIGANTMLVRAAPAAPRNKEKRRRQRLLLFMPHITLRTEELSYDNLWNKAGFSGTESAFMEIGKLLVDSGRFEVTVIGYAGNAPTRVDPGSGIRFQQWSSFGTAESEDGINDYDWYCPLFYVFEPQHHELMRQIRDKKKTKVLVWLHCFLDNDAVLHHWIHEQQYQVYGMAVSQWVYDKYIPCFDDGKLWLVPNGVAPRFHEYRPLQNKERGMWCFHPMFSRGGNVSVRVFDAVRMSRCPAAAQSFEMMSYDINDHSVPMPSSFVRCHGSLSKTQVAAILGKAEYFVYPLVHPHGAVHHDTFGCVIMEALAMGVIVITWNIACVPSLYGDHVVALPPPANYAADDRWAYDPWFLSEEAVAQLADAVVSLDADPERKAELRRRGMEWARQQTWDIGAKNMMERM